MNQFEDSDPSDSYRALFTIEDTVDADTFLATLLNNSFVEGPTEPLIDLLAFNTNTTGAVFGTDFDIVVLTAGWTLDSTPPGGVDFEFLITEDPGLPDNRLGIGDSLTFLVLDLDLLDGISVFDIFLTAEESDGGGIGGGAETGQKAVSFQQLGDDGEGSDLLVDNWDPPNVITENPEPSSLILLGSGLLGIASLLRRRNQN